jgi:anaerobic ribonucleoside-triphosphate reductase activating protein
MYFSEIKKTDIANGTGVRVTLFVSGCRRHCKNCFNSETWSFTNGKPFTDETQRELLDALNHSYINGLTLLGGEPMEIENQRALLPFLRRVRAVCPNKDVWCYTGCTLERDLYEGGAYHCEATDELLSLIDVLVDGEFIEEKKNLRLIFCGSENQRLIDLKKMRKAGSRDVILHELKR